MKHQDFIIAVITRGRVNTQVFLENVPEHIRSLVTLCCHPGELQMHKKRWGNRLANIIEYGKDCINIGEARHWFMEYCRQNSIRYAIQVDDNVRFAARVNRGGRLTLTCLCLILQTISMMTYNLILLLKCSPG